MQTSENQHLHMTYKKEKNKKNIPKVEMHMRLSPHCHHYACYSDGLVVGMCWF
jgi:hypothetical protein